MTFAYVSVEEAIERRGVRMVVVGNVPSPWGEAAKGILHIKGIEWAAVRLAYDSEALQQWAGQRNGPVLIYDDERPRSGWAEILLLAERLAPAPPLIPAKADERALAFGLAHEICGEGGLGWSRRLQLIHAGLNNSGGFPERVSKYLAKKYRYSPAAGAAAGARVVALLTMLAARLKAQQQAGSRYYIGDSLTAVAVYSATCRHVRPAAARGLQDGRKHEGGVQCAGRRYRRGTGSDFSCAPGHDVRPAPGAAALALIDGDARDAR
jgi:glutathione S-transferase